MKVATMRSGITHHAHTAVAALLLATLPACSSRSAPVAAPTPAYAPLSDAYKKAAEIEQLEGDAGALTAYLDLIDRGLRSGPAGGPAVLASLDALLWRGIYGLERVSPQQALAFRHAGAIATIEQKLGEYYQSGEGVAYARTAIAQGLYDLARYRGDANAARTWREKSGLILNATGFGPLDAYPLRAVDQPTELEAATATLKPTYAGLAPFNKAAKPQKLEADEGVLDIGDISAQPGLYGVVVDVVVKQPTKLWVTLQSTSAATVVVGGKVTVVRPFSSGGALVTKLGTADVAAGTARVVVRYAANDDGARFALRITDDRGNPLETKAPHEGDQSTVAVSRAEPFEFTGVRKEFAELFSAALASLGEWRSSARLLESFQAQGPLTPLGSLQYARTVYRADDVPEIRRIERMRSAFEKTVEAWPNSWEATIGKAIMTGARKSFVEGRTETIRDLEARRLKDGSLHPIVAAFESGTAHEAGLPDIARKAQQEATQKLAQTPLAFQLESRVLPRAGKDAIPTHCTAPLRDQQATSCMYLHAGLGNSQEFYAELNRLRELRGAPSALKMAELRQRLIDGDLTKVLKIYDEMPNGQRMLSLLTAFANAPAEIKSRLERDQLSARDAPMGISTVRHFLQDDQIKKLEAKGAQIVAAERSSPQSTTAATLVLEHTETYDVSPEGLVHHYLHDVRKVSGTTDVEQGVGGTLATMLARDLRRVVRRVVHKKDGRTLEPDRPSMAAQGNADLSQLEPGDMVEQIVEGWALPSRTGQLVVDTPDLLPERTGVKNATITIRIPKDVAFALTSHPLLGKANERAEQGYRVLEYTMRDALPRRIEDGLARMDRDVGVSFGTYTWDQVARHLAESYRALDDRDPYITRWTQENVGVKGATKANVDKAVSAVGKTIKVANGSLLTDIGASYQSGAQMMTARHALELGQGSRTWVLLRVLREIGVESEVAVSEHEPFSANPNFPARPGRFDHPLLLVHLPANEGGDLWIDADVAGPPLPAGRISPELRGRMALRQTGEMVAVQSNSADLGDEVSVELAVDAQGNAQGTLIATQRGRAAQQLSDALERVVGHDRREMLRSVILGWVPWATVNEVALTSTEGSWEVTIRAQISIPSFAQKEGASWVIPGLEPLHVVFPRASVMTLGSRFATQAGRQTALAVDSAYQYKLHRKLSLPQGSSIVSVPNVSVKNARVEAKRQPTVSGNVIEEDFVLSVSTGTVAADEYQKFATELKKVDDGFLGTTRAKMP